LALLTTLVVLSSFFVIAGAQVASAAQCGQVNNPPACSLQFRLEDPAKSGIYTDTSPHQAAVGETITRVDLDPKGPSVVVEAEGADGHRDTNYGGLISVAISSGTGKLSGTTTVAAVNGAASFTDLSIDTKGHFELTATATGAGIAPGFSGTFVIHKDRCSTGETCTDAFGTLMDASLTNGGTGRVGLSVGIDILSDCSAIPGSEQFFHAPAEWTVDEVQATSPSTKLLVIRIDKSLRQFIGGGKVLNRSPQLYRPCITATVEPPATWNNTPVISETTGEFTFLAADCDRTITYFCRPFSKSNKAGDVLQGISLPSGILVNGIPIDPRGN